jgi:ribonuclease HI
VPGGRYRSGAEPATTNQRMEINAVLDAVTTFDGPLEVVSDSTYVVNCFRDRWWEGWLARDWKNSAKKPVANRDLWEPLIQAYRADPARIRFTWVKGHSDDVMNDLVDQLAVDASRTQQGREGEGVPTDLGPADLPGGAVAAGGSDDPRLPPGRRLVIVGHRPPGIGGYDDNLMAEGVRRRLAEILGAKAQLHEDLVVLTGLGLGAEQLGAEAARETGVPFVAVLPYPEPDSVWPAASRARFRHLLDDASGEVVLQSKAPTSKQQAGGALARRDAWLARHADEAIAVWDGTDAAVGKQVRSLQDSVGEDEVWLLNPNDG